MDKPVRIYIDIESLFDMRMGRLSFLYGEEELSKLLADDSYNFRDSDVFSIDMEEYDRLGKDVRGILGRSVVTYVLGLVKEKLQGLEKTNIQSKKSKIPEIVLNVYPLILEEKEIEIIQSGIFMKLKEDVFISVVSMDMKEVGASFLSGGNFLYAFIYEFNEWLNVHLDDIVSRRVKLHDTLLYFPRLYKGDRMSESKEVSDPFEYLMMLLSNVLHMRFLPPVFYSSLPIGIEIIENLNALIIRDSGNNGGEDVDIS